MLRQSADDAAAAPLELPVLEEEHGPRAVQHLDAAADDVRLEALRVQLHERHARLSVSLPPVRERVQRDADARRAPDEVAVVQVVVAVVRVDELGAA